MGSRPSHDGRYFNCWPPRSQNLEFPMFDVMGLGILARMDNLLSFLCVFLILPGTTFTEYGKILFLENLARLWVVSERFWLERWSLEYQGVCIMPGAAITPWERVPSTLQLFQRKRLEHFTCFFLTYVIIYLKRCVPNFPHNYKLLLFSKCFMMNLKLQNAAQRAYLCEVYEIIHI